MHRCFYPPIFGESLCCPAYSMNSSCCASWIKKATPLARLNDIVDWQIFLPILEQALGAKDKSSAGRKPYPPLFMFKILIFQSLYNLSDEDAEREQLKDLLARRFVGLSGRQFGPDATTI